MPLTAGYWKAIMGRPVTLAMVLKCASAIGGFQGSCRLKVKITPPYLC